MGVVDLIVGVVGAAAQMSATKKMAAAQREAGAVSTASGDIRDRAARRRAAREERLRRARLIASSRASGAGNSSGEIGGLASLSTGFESSVASQTEDRLANEGISAANQRYADARFKYDSAALWSNLISGSIDQIQAMQKV